MNKWEQRTPLISPTLASIMTQNSRPLWRFFISEDFPVMCHKIYYEVNSRWLGHEFPSSRAKMFALKISTFYSPGEMVSMRNSISTMTRGPIAIYTSRLLIIFTPAVPLFQNFIHQLILIRTPLVMASNLSILLLLTSNPHSPPPASSSRETENKAFYLRAISTNNQSEQNTTRGTRRRWKEKLFYLF